MPSYSEMLNVFGLRSKNAVFKRVSALIDAGFLEKDKRGKLIPKRSMMAVPLLGSIQAGFPSPAEEELQDVVSLDEYLISNPNATFLVTVQGDSMIDAHIADGDMVICEQVNSVDNGEIVVAVVDGEFATLKRFFKEKNRIRLQPENPKMDPIYATEVEIKGKVVGVIRRY